jgi:hypothetical protein
MIKISLIEDFFHLPPVSMTKVVQLELCTVNLHKFSKQSEMPYWDTQGHVGN